SAAHVGLSPIGLSPTLGFERATLWSAEPRRRAAAVGGPSRFRAGRTQSRTFSTSSKERRTPIGGKSRHLSRGRRLLCENVKRSRGFWRHSSVAASQALEIQSQIGSRSVPPGSFAQPTPTKA